MKLMGFVYNSIEYKETSKIVYLYTIQGHVSVKAIGANKPKSQTFGFGQTGNIVSFVASDTPFLELEEYSTVKSLYKLTESIEGIKAINVLVNIIKLIPNDSNHERIFALIEKTVADMLSGHITKALDIFLIKLTYVFGIKPTLKECVNCRSKEFLKFFDERKGGALCINCMNVGNPEILSIFKEYYYDKKDIEKYSTTNFDILNKVIKEYYLYNADIKLNL